MNLFSEARRTRNNGNLKEDRKMLEYLNDKPQTDEIKRKILKLENKIGREEAREDNFQKRHELALQKAAAPKFDQSKKSTTVNTTVDSSKKFEVSNNNVNFRKGQKRK